MDRIAKLMKRMVAYEAGVPQRVHHFLKVYGFCQMIGMLEQVDDKTMEILETAALVHDIGIKKSLEKYGSDAGGYQQTEGPSIARKLLEELDYPAKLIERVCYLVAHHHTYNDIDGQDYQILVEADFLVNILEGEMGTPQILSVKKMIFKTRAGTETLDKMFLTDSSGDA